jgi:hypothetical protein
MSLASTLTLLRPTLSAYINLTKFGLIQCSRDNFQLELNPKAPALARDMATTMFAMGPAASLKATR